MFWHLRIADPGVPVLLRASQFLELVNNFPVSMHFKCKLNSQSATLKYFLYGLLTLDHYPPALLTSGPGTRQLGTAPSPRNWMKLFKVANPKPAFPVSPVLSWENDNKVFCPQFPPSLCLLTKPGASPCAPTNPIVKRGYAFFSWELWVINYLFVGICLLICWSYYYLIFLKN